MGCSPGRHGQFPKKLLEDLTMTYDAGNPHVSAAAKYDAEARGNLKPWQKSRRLNDYDTGFVNHLWTWLKAIDARSEVPRVNAYMYINNRMFREDGLANLEAHWEAYREAMQAQATMEDLPKAAIAEAATYDPNSPEQIEARAAARAKLPGWRAPSSASSEGGQGNV
jgi:hypothetical protein